MYLPDSADDSGTSHALALLASASAAPAHACANDPEVQRAFDEGLRALAEDILRFHPGLAHLLVGMSTPPCPYVHGQN